MIQTWQLQEAKNKLSHVVERAVTEGPQFITKHGVKVAVIISYDDYQGMLTSRGKLSEFFRNSPLVGVELDLTRDTSNSREPLDL